MNKKVWLTLLFLLVGVLVAFNVLKFFFPEQFIMCLTDTKILTLGNFLEQNSITYEATCILCSYISFCLLAVVSKRSWKLSFIDFVWLAILEAISQLLYEFVPEISIYAGVGTMLLIPLFIGKNTKGFLIAFETHNICQYLILFVRGYTEALPEMNLGSDLCLYMESFIILICFGIIYTLKGNQNEQIKSTNNK